jgi:rare lipoprotein A (peptidoglycan hydrolase)
MKYGKNLLSVASVLLAIAGIGWLNWQRWQGLQTARRGHLSLVQRITYSGMESWDQAAPPQRAYSALSSVADIVYRLGKDQWRDRSKRLVSVASWYGPALNGLPTANGEIFNENALTAAHPTLPFDTYLRVTNLDNGRSVIVRINDRSPQPSHTIDLSKAAAKEIGALNAGMVPVELEIVQPDSNPAFHRASR